MTPLFADRVDLCKTPKKLLTDDAIATCFQLQQLHLAGCGGPPHQDPTASRTGQLNIQVVPSCQHRAKERQENGKSVDTGVVCRPQHVSVEESSSEELVGTVEDYFARGGRLADSQGISSLDFTLNSLFGNNGVSVDGAVPLTSYRGNSWLPSHHPTTISSSVTHPYTLPSHPITSLPHSLATPTIPTSLEIPGPGGSGHINTRCKRKIPPAWTSGVKVKLAALYIVFNRGLVSMGVLIIEGWRLFESVALCIIQQVYMQPTATPTKIN